MDLSIIIVNYNGGKELFDCLQSLDAVRQELTFEAIVVDNGSTDGSLDEAERRFKGIITIRAGENLGFGAACNRGLLIAQGRHFMLLNPDTVVQPQALARLVKALDLHPNWGIVGPRMLDQNQQVYRAARRFPRPFDLFCESTRLAFIFPHWKFFAGYFYSESIPESLDEVDQIEGSALVISGKARATVGDLDPQFFIFFEEVDWCKRVRAAGWEIHVVQDAEVMHIRSSSMSKSFTFIREIHAQSCMKYFRKHYGEQGLRKIRCWMRTALRIREMGMWIAAIAGRGSKAKLRAKTSRLERQVYQRGLEA
jgi:GT2 family glycosyltransferase